MGYTGAGIKVAVMDSGIDYDHPDLGGCFGPGVPRRERLGLRRRCVQRRPVVADYSPTPTPDPLPDDCNGHGTHVAGIIGANGRITGVAPGVTFDAYRVFGCEGPTTTDIMLAAMERALADGADILNMSIGAAFTVAAVPDGEGAPTALVEQGMVVVASIGNRAPNGLYSAAAPASART